MNTTKKLVIASWVLSIFVFVLSVFVWLQGMHWHFSKFSSISYQLFPVFGLVAFGVMWSHYIAAALRVWLGIKKEALHSYFETTSLVVLVAIVLHPSILWLQLWKDGFGLPPQSYLVHYVAPSVRWAAFLGTLSLLVFLGYEFRRKFESRHWWQYVSLASDMAMIAIFIHGLKLGKNLYSGWFPYVWYLYGITLIASIAYMYQQKYKTIHKAAGHVHS